MELRKEAGITQRKGTAASSFPLIKKAKRCERQIVEQYREPRTLPAFCLCWNCFWKAVTEAWGG